MNKIIILSGALFLSTIAIYATVSRNQFNLNIKDNFNQEEPIQFSERGIDFFVYKDGLFDFNTKPNENNGNYYFRNSASNLHRDDNNFGTRIDQDNFGRIRRIGNTFINYDAQNRVARIGSVFLRYNRFALIQIGGLQLIYNSFGELVNTFGSVKSRNYGFVRNNNGCNNFNNNYESNNNYDYQYSNPNVIKNDNEYYYYRNDGTKVKTEDNNREIESRKK